MTKARSSRGRPWLAQYGHVPAELRPAHESGLDMFRATVRRDPDAPICFYFEESVSAGAVDRMSDSLASFLAEQGTASGDRVAMYLQNVPEVLVTVVAAWKLGAVVVPCNPMLRGRELKKILVDSGCRAMICHDDLFESVAAPVLRGTAVEVVVTTSPLDLAGQHIPPVLSGVERRAAKGATPLPEIFDRYSAGATHSVTLGPADVALMVYTSGTTGAPKGATNTHGNVVAASSIYEAWLGVGPTDVILGIAPLFHVTGLIGHVGLTLLTGAPLVLSSRFDTEEACRLAEKHGATFTVSAVTAFIALMNSDALGRYDLSSLRKVYTGGAPTPPAVLREWRDRTGSSLQPMYGLTEATSPTHMTPLGQEPPLDPHTGVVSVGVPVPGTDVRVIADDGREAAPGEIGELYISGPQIVPRYWQKPAESAEAFRHGELRTGDVGFMDERGYFYLVDRAKDMIVASGFKVWPREVEDVLYEHPAVREAAVVGVPDPYRGETVMAAVSLKPGSQVTADDIKLFARERMAAYKYPRIVELFDELPKTTSGKILRSELREKSAAQPALAPPSLGVSYAELRSALEARAVIELGVTWRVLGREMISVGSAVNLYQRLERMLATVRADGRFIDREAFLDANHDYHAFLVALADNGHLQRGFDGLGLRALFGELLRSSEATSEQVVLQHERLTDAVAADSVSGATEAILGWAAAAERHVRFTLSGAQHVQAPPLTPVFEVMPAPRGGRSSAALLLEALEAQAALEVGVLRLIQNKQESELLRAVLVAHTPLFPDRGGAEAEMTEARLRAHRALIGAVGNPLLLQVHDSLHLSELLSRTKSVVGQTVAHLLDHGQGLLVALELGDVDGAVEAIDQRLSTARTTLLGKRSPQHRMTNQSVSSHA